MTTQAEIVEHAAPISREYGGGILIGSRAGMYHALAAGDKKIQRHFDRNSDWDFLTVDGFDLPEDESIDLVRSTTLHDVCPVDEHNVITLDGLYTLKLSHVFWSSPAILQKTVRDIHALQVLGAEMDDDFYQVAHKVWKQVYPDKKVSLNKSAEEFFTGAVDRYFVHDSVHRMVAFFDAPMFTYFLKDGEEVLTDKNKFFVLPYEKQLAAVIEETIVLTLERNIIPSKKKPDEFEVRRLMIRQLGLLITRYTSGWFPLFVAENWMNIIRAPLFAPAEVVPLFEYALQYEDVLEPGDKWDHRDNTWWGHLVD